LLISDSSETLLITGGDDGAIHLTKINEGEKLCGGEDYCVERLMSVEDAHASTVTGILFLREVRCVSVGIDQKIKLWSILDGKKLVCLREGYTFVPDVAGIIEIPPKDAWRFVIFGTGMEMIRLDNDDSSISTSEDSSAESVVSSKSVERPAEGVVSWTDSVVSSTTLQ
jgi:WD40 repeat protein